MKKNGLIKAGNNSSKEQSSKKKKYSKSQNKLSYSLKVKDKKEIKIIPFINVFNEKEKQINKSICQIYNPKNNKTCSGFFMQTSLFNKRYYFLITSNNLMDHGDLDNKETIVIYFMLNEKKEKRLIKIDYAIRPCFYFYRPLDTIVIGIVDSDNIPKEIFLYPDLTYEKGIISYRNKNCYIAGFEKKNQKLEKFIYLCDIKNIDRFEFTLNINKGPESFGSLICSPNKLEVIGLVKEGKINNIGLFIFPVINKLDNIRRNIDVSNNASLYKGTFCLHLRHGKGVCYYNNGDVYEGEWKNDLREGKGKMYYSNGNVYEGEWKNDRREGNGIFYFCNGGVYTGEFKNNIISGYGKLSCYYATFVGTLELSGLDNSHFNVVHFLAGE